MDPRRKLSLWYCLWLVFNMIALSECRNSRVCLSSQPLDTACRKHILKCEDDTRIRIKSSRYMFINRSNYENCVCGSEMCDSCPGLNQCNQEQDPQNRPKPCGNMNYNDLLSKCSYQGQCEVPVPSQQDHTCLNSTSMLRPCYSDIEYSCLEVNNVVDFCNGNKSGKLLSILYNSSSNENNCRCRIKSLDTSGSKKTYFMRSMDIRNLTSEGVGSFNLSFTSGNKSRNVVNGNVKHNSRLFEAPTNQESVITLSISRNSKSPDRLWILVNGETQVTCQSEDETTTSDPSSPKATTNKVLQSTEETKSTLSTQDPRSAKATTNKVLQSTEQTTSTLSTQVGVAVASVAGSFVVIAAIIVALIIYQRKRNAFEIRQEEQRVYNKPARNLLEDETVYSVIEENPEVTTVQENRTGVTEQRMSK